MTECLLTESDSAHINRELKCELTVFELQGNQLVETEILLCKKSRLFLLARAVRQVAYEVT